MIACYLMNLLIFTFMLRSAAQPVFDCPMTVSVGDSAKLTCSNLVNSVIIKNPVGITVGNCVGRTTCVIPEAIEGIDIVLMDNKTILLTVHDIDKEDEGMWTCESGSTAECSLTVYKLSSCEISSTSSTNNLSLGQDLPLNIYLTDYYCTNSIVWNLTIGGESQNINEFRDREETDDISSRVVTYSPTVTSSLTGRVELTFNCNDKTYDVSCSGVKELQLRDPPSCKLTSDDDTDDLTSGNNLILQADIEEYPCTTGIKYALVSGSGMIAEFFKSGTIFYAIFEVKPEYLDKQLHLKYTCNSVSATTRTEGVTILLTKDDIRDLQAGTLWGLILAIGGLPVGVILFVVLGILILYRKKRRSSSNETPFYDIPSYGMNTEVQYQDLIRGDGTRPRDPDTQNVLDVEYETPDTRNAPHSQYESIDDIEQAPTTERRTCGNETQYGNADNQPQENGHQEYLSAVFERT